MGCQYDAIKNCKMRQDHYLALIPALLPIARQAGDAIMAVYAAGESAVAHKADHSPVTAADHAAHRVLAAQLQPLLPNCPVVSEEDEASHAQRQSTGRFWLIDPLDGTKEFIARNGEFTVNIALIEDGRSVLGVVFAPASGELYWGGHGLGAFCQRGEETIAIATASVSSTAPASSTTSSTTSASATSSETATPSETASASSQPAEVCRVVVSRSHLDTETQAFIDRLAPVGLVQAGSSLKFCRVAEGAADIYPRMGPTCEWDTAAAQAVLEGAGGVVLDLHGVPLRYGKPELLNPFFIAARDAALIPASSISITRWPAR
jgi:3'(2'), 5'-bisphosphate nucleotidase